MPALYATEARAVGGRAGHVETPDGLLAVDLALPKEMGGRGGATNPEQLFAVRFIAGQQKLPLKGAAVTAHVELHPRAEGGFKLAVSLDAETQGLDQATAETLVAAAHQVCPYSNAVRGNIDVGITVRAA
jgi:osmotically inducible protein OsmC